MGPFRSLSPSNEDQSGKDIELADQLQDQEKSQHLANEESERLLPGGEDRGSEEGADELHEAKVKEYTAPRKPLSKWLRWGLVGLAGTVLFTILALLLVRGSEARAARSKAMSFRRPSADYVVPGDWDFQEPPKARHQRWTITDITANPDGVYRPMTVINGKFPGPMITCNEGDTIVIEVINHAKNATSIHWHGLFQNGSNHMDGAVGVTQCPIAPGETFRYEFTVKGQAGSYFYHGHHAAQSLDGLVGPIVILSPAEKKSQAYSYDTDRVVLVQDWYHDPSPGLLRETLSPGSEGSPIPDGVLINGRNKVDCSLHPGRRCDNSYTQFATWDLVPNQRHRLRIINVGGYGWFEVSVDKHLELPVTEVDGVAVEPVTDSTVLIGPGQRYSVLLRTDQSLHSGLYWFRARMLTHCFGENVAPGAAEATAILRYELGRRTEKDREAKVKPKTKADSGKFTLVCKDPAPGTYQPRPKRAAPSYAHHSWYFRVNIEIGNWRLERGFLNQSSMRPQVHAPTLHRVVDGLATRNASFDVEGVNDVAFDRTRELVISSKEVEVVDVILQNFDEGDHPFHLHGMQMFILAAGHGYFPGYEALGLKPEGKGLLHNKDRAIVENPTRRDVTTVESFGWTLVRFVADNPGVWMFHCHMIWHGEAGMGMQFVSRMDLMSNWTISEENAKLCEAPVAELERGATPKDEIWFGHTSVLDRSRG